MIFKNYYDFAQNEWIKGMESSEHFSLDKRNKEETKALWDNISKTYDSSLGGELKRVTECIDILISKNIINENSTVLDIGCGTGNYSVSLSKIVKKVYALDSSKGMLEKLKTKIDENQIKNIEIIENDWEDFYESNTKKYDLVIGSLNPALYNYEALEKMINLSKGYCLYITSASVGNGTDNYIGDLNKIVFKRELKNSGGNNIIHPFNILFAKGYYPQIHYFSSKWEKDVEVDELIESLYKRYSGYLELTDEIKEEIKNYVKINSSNGIFKTKSSSKLGAIIWKI